MALQSSINTVEIRETWNGRVVAKRTFNSNAPDLSSFFHFPASFSIAGKSLLYLDSDWTLHEWNFEDGADLDRFQLEFPNRFEL